MKMILRLTSNVPFYPSFQTFIDNREIKHTFHPFSIPYALENKVCKSEKILKFKLSLLGHDNRNNLFKILAIFFSIVIQMFGYCFKTYILERLKK